MLNGKAAMNLSKLLELVELDGEILVIQYGKNEGWA